MITFFKTIIYTPLYNFFVLMLNISWMDAGLAAVLLTVLVKLLLYPISRKATLTQLKMKQKESELLVIKNKYPDKQEQAVKTMEFYRENQINPFSGILGLLIQIPVIFSLYYIFFRSGLPLIDHNLLYSFIKEPLNVSMKFLGLWDVSKPSVILAILASLSTFGQMHFSAQSNIGQNSASKGELSQVLAQQMKYTMPVVVFLISWKISGVVALYWFVSNLLGMVQDVYIRKTALVNA